MFIIPSVVVVVVVGIIVVVVVCIHFQAIDPAAVVRTLLIVTIESASFN